MRARCVSFEWIDIVEGSEMTGDTIEAVSKQMCSEIIGIRRHGKDSILPDHGTVIEVEDSILVISGKKIILISSSNNPLERER